MLEATISYKKEFGDVSLDLVGGYSYQEFARDGFGSEGAGFTTNNLDQIGDQLQSTYKTIDNLIDGSYSVFGYGNDGSYLNRLFPDISLSETLPTSF